MYNRYIPRQLSYEPIPPAGERGGPGEGERRTAGTGRGILNGLLGSLGGGGSAGQGLSGLLKSLHLDDLDTGDILLALIVLLLILEDGDNLDLVITLGLMILFSLGES